MNECIFLCGSNPLLLEALIALCLYLLLWSSPHLTFIAVNCALNVTPLSRWLALTEESLAQSFWYFL